MRIRKGLSGRKKKRSLNALQRQFSTDSGTGVHRRGLAGGVLWSALLGLLMSFIVVPSASAVTNAVAQEAQQGSTEQLRGVAPAVAPVPRDPSELFLEDFENMGSGTPAMGLESYVGAGGMTYTADAAWLDQTECNGLLIKYTDSGTLCPNGFRAGENNIRRLSDVLGQYATGVQGGTPETPVNGSSAVTQANHALAAFTFIKNIDYRGIMMETNTPIPLASGKYITASVDIAETSCQHLNGANNSLLNFYILSGSESFPLQSDPIRACADKNAESYASPELQGGWAGGQSYVNAATYYSNGSVLMGLEPVGLQLQNATRSFDGNDAAIDNIRLVDSTPSLYKEFSTPDTEKRSTLKFTVMNTSELAAKRGWSFKDAIDPSLTIDQASVATTCAEGNISFAGQTMSVSGDLDAGQISCEFTVTVAATSVGTFRNCPVTNVTELIGLLAPECATLKVGDYTVTKSSEPAKGTEVLPGDVVRYDLTVASTADSPEGAIVPIRVTDVLGGVVDDATYNGDVSVSSGAATSLPDGDIEWTADLLAPQTATLSFTVTVKEKPVSGDQRLKNFVTKNGETPPITCLPTDTKCTEHRVLIPGLSVMKSADPVSGTTLTRGDTVTYSVVAENTGDTPLENVVMSDDLSEVLDDADLVSGSLTTSSGAAPTVLGTTLSWTGDLAVNEKVTLTYKVKVKTDSIVAATLLNKVTGAGEVPGGPEVPSNCVTGTELGCTTTHPVAKLTPGFVLKKTADPAANTEVKRGETVTYTVVAENTGDTPLSNVVVSDDLSDVLDDAEVVAGSLKASQGSDPNIAGASLSWVGDLGIGEKVTLTYQATVKDNAAGGAKLLNRVVGEGEAPGGVEVPSNCVTGSEPDCTTTHPLAATSVKIEKTDGKAVVGAGESLTYDVMITNTGVDRITGVVATDLLPDGLTYAMSSDSGSYDPALRRVTWNIGSLGGGSSKVVTVTVKVDTDVVPGQQFRNVAIVDTEQGCTDDPGTPDNECEAVDIDESPALKIVKTDNTETVVPGELLTYTMTVKNNGKMTVEDAMVSDVLPAELEFVSAGQGGSYDDATREVKWTVASLDAGVSTSVELTVKVAESIGTGVDITNVATVDLPQGCINDPATSEDECGSTDVDHTPAISIEKDDKKTIVKPGEELTYDLLVKNASKYEAKEVTVTDELPSNLVFVSATSGGVYDPATHTVSWGLGSMEAESDLTVRVVTQVAATVLGNEVVSNTARVLTENVCVNDTTSEQDECEDTDSDRVPAVSITKDDGKTIVRSGETLDYVLTAKNIGDVDAPDVIVTDTLPANVDFVNSSIPGAQSAVDVLEYSWDLGTLAPGESREIVVTVKVHEKLKPDTDIVNTAKITTNGICIDAPETEMNECDATDIDVTPSDVWILKDDHKVEVKVGEKLTYDLTIGNNSETKTIVDAVVTDSLPKNAEFVSATDSGVVSADGQTVTWKLAELAPGAKATVRVTVKVATVAKAGDEVINTAKVDIAGGCIQEDACETMDRDVIPKLTIAKTDHQETTKPGEKLAYDVTITNKIDVDAEEVRVTDKLPANVEYLSSSDKGSYDKVSHSVTWSLGTLAGNAVKTVKVTVRVNADATAGVTNVAVVKSPKACTDTGGCEAVDETLIDPPLDLSPGNPLAMTGGESFGTLLGLAVLLMLVGGVGTTIAQQHKRTRIRA